ncbi:MAG TPA: four helix bundle protein [Chthoniobacter sp.]|jgi:four helix bundle protein
MKDEENGGRRGNDLAERLQQFALRSIKVFVVLPKTDEARVLGKQFLRSATSVRAHYREVRRAKSDADFVSKVEGALQELDETDYWLGLIAESGILNAKRLESLITETNELTAIFVTIAKKGKGL